MRADAAPLAYRIASSGEAVAAREEENSVPLSTIASARTNASRAGTGVRRNGTVNSGSVPAPARK